MRQASRYAAMVDAVCISMVKTLGSSLKQGEWSITLTKDEVNSAKTYEKLVINEGPNGEVILTVQTDPDMQAQIDAFKAELETPETATSEQPVVEVPDDFNSIEG